MIAEAYQREALIADSYVYYLSQYFPTYLVHGSIIYIEPLRFRLMCARGTLRKGSNVQVSWGLVESDVITFPPCLLCGCVF